MKNVRRFQRVILVSFVGINSIVYTEMKAFLFSEQLVFIITAIAIATLLVLSASYVKKGISKKMNKPV